MATITSVNAIYTLSITNLFDAPVQLQGFAADDIFTTEVIVPTEAIMGLDGKLSAGFVNVPTVQSIMLQADSDSNSIFDDWVQAQRTAQDAYYAQGVVILVSIGKKYAMTNGVLTSLPPMADAARTLRPRRFGITWEKVEPADI